MDSNYLLLFSCNRRNRKRNWFVEEMETGRVERLGRQGGRGKVEGREDVAHSIESL